MEVAEDPGDPEGDDRVHRHVDVEDEAERTRKLQKCEKILTHPVTGVRISTHASAASSIMDQDNDVASPDPTDSYS
jgi:hypothetical protein